MYEDDGSGGGLGCLRVCLCAFAVFLQCACSVLARPACFLHQRSHPRVLLPPCVCMCVRARVRAVQWASLLKGRKMQSRHTHLHCTRTMHSPEGPAALTQENCAPFQRKKCSVVRHGPQNWLRGKSSPRVEGTRLMKSVGVEGRQRNNDAHLPPALEEGGNTEEWEHTGLPGWCTDMTGHPPAACSS